MWILNVPGTPVPCAFLPSASVGESRGACVLSVCVCVCVRACVRALPGAHALCGKVCLTWLYNSAYTGFFVFLISCSGKHHSIMRTLPKKNRVIQEHMQRVTTWPSHLIGNAVVFISLPPRKGNQRRNFPKPRCNSSSLPPFHKDFHVFF